MLYCNRAVVEIIDSKEIYFLVRIISKIISTCGFSCMHSTPFTREKAEMYSTILIEIKFIAYTGCFESEASMREKF